jgi:serine/threonine-protein kinase
MPVAIKMLRPRIIRSRPGLAASLCEEARYAAKINHPNVVRVFDVSHTPTITYVVMEYLDGSTLAKVIKSKGPQPARTVVTVGLDIAAGLQAGLEQGLCHRDIKPANIIITRAGTTKIVDLGLARSSTLDAHEPGASDSSIVGTYGYMAPEQILTPAHADFRADIYALGVTLYHAAVGQPPFPSDNPERCLQMHCQDPVPPANIVRHDVPAALSDLLLWMLAKSPADRPASYAALEDDLRRVLQSLP